MLKKEHREGAPALDIACTGLVIPRHAREGLTIIGGFHAELIRAGRLVWQDDFHNLVLNAGKADMLDKYFAGSAYTAAWYMGLVDGGSAPTYNANDTSAAHAGWTENTGFSNATRPAIAWNAASASGGGAGAAGTGSKASTATAFNINAPGTVAGCFLAAVNTKGGATGIFFSAGSFTGGNRTVANGDTLNVTWTGSN